MRAILVLPVLIGPLSAAPQAGTLDPTFGTGGVVTTSLYGEDNAIAMALQPDGRIIVVGEASDGSGSSMGVVRYLEDGQLDQSFGDGGVVLTEVGPASLAMSVLVQPDGKIAVFGASWGNSDVIVVRYHADGTLDNGFGGDGIVTTDFEGGNDGAFDGVLQSDGKILAVGKALINGSYRMAMVRYNTDGSLDQAFDDDGKLNTVIGASDDMANAVVLQPDGKIVAAGHASDFQGQGEDFLVVRFLPSGDPDPSFDGDGVKRIPVGTYGAATCLTLQPDGKIIVAGEGSIQGEGAGYVLARLHPDGSLDDTFGTSGLSVTGVGSWPGSVALQSDGKILVGGYYLFTVLRLDHNGLPDATFSEDGIVTTSISGIFDYGHALTLQPDGRILMAGYTGDWSGSSFAVVRYLNDPDIGISELEAGPASVSFLPNPVLAQGLLEFESGASGHLSCAIFDLQGRTVLTPFSHALHPAGPNRDALDLGGLAAGSYVLRLSSASRSISVRFEKL